MSIKLIRMLKILKVTKKLVQELFIIRLREISLMRKYNQPNQLHLSVMKHIMNTYHFPCFLDNLLYAIRIKVLFYLFNDLL